jgi:UPF0755 protein
MNQPKRLALGLILLLTLIVGGFSIAQFAIFAFSPSKLNSTESLILEVKKGESPQVLTRELLAGGAISDGFKFNWLGRITRQWKKVKAGEYKFSPSMTPIEVFSILTSGISMVHPVTVREGENMYEIAADIEGKKLASREAILALCKNPTFIATLGFAPGSAPTLEGYLYPDTYNFNRSMSPQDMLRQMVKHFFAVWGDKETLRAKELGMSRHQIVTLASMIEKETGAARERPIISSVFYNRLKKKMRLQSDPTTIYGIWDRYKGNIHKADLLSESPYNTYYVPALPAGPISNPGKEALQAALYPATSEYLFFVSHNDGTHEFTRTYQEHTRAVGKFQLDASAREGKSWRDLRKSNSQADQKQVGQQKK